MDFSDIENSYKLLDKHKDSIESLSLGVEDSFSDYTKLWQEICKLKKLNSLELVKHSTKGFAGLTSTNLPKKQLETLKVSSSLSEHACKFFINQVEGVKHFELSNA